MSNEKALAEVIEAVKAFYPDAEVYCHICTNGSYSIGSQSTGKTISAAHWDKEAAWRDAYSRLPSSAPPAQDEEFEKWWQQNFGKPENEMQHMVRSTAYHAWQAALASVLPAPQPQIGASDE